MTVYALRRGILLGIVGALLPLAFAFGGYVAFTDHPPKVFLGVFFLLCTAGVGWLTVRGLRLWLPHRDQPYLLVDDEGIECARGRFWWRDIRRVVDVVHKEASPALLFVLEEGTTPQPVERAYFDVRSSLLGTGASLTPYGLELEVGNCAKQARSALASYGHPPVRAKREELSTTKAVDLARD